MQPEDNKQEPNSSAGWVFHPGDAAQPNAPAAVETPPAESAPADTSGNDVRWTASEYVAHDRGASWYLGLGGVTAALVGTIFFLTRDYISSVMIIIVAVIFGVFASRKPHVLEYEIDNYGINIGAKNYPFQLFKSFSVSDDDSIRSLLLMPLKRFMPIISIYFEKKDEDKIINKIADFLPFEEYKQDVIDKMMNKIRF